jgi:hypothetical protein
VKLQETPTSWNIIAGVKQASSRYGQFIFAGGQGAVSVSCRLVGFYDGLVTIQGMSRAILLAMDGPSDGQNIFYEINL